MKTVQIGSYNVGAGQPLSLMAGPCVVENEKMIMQTAESIMEAVSGIPVQFIFKASYKKANRTSLKGFTSIGIDEALKILGKVRETFQIPVVTDIHKEGEASATAEVADVLQIPAFLCRQTDLIVAAAKTGRAVNIKKGQFLAPEDMANAAEKAIAAGNENVLLTERGTSFGYRNLVVDMRGLQVMASSGCPVVYDATHSVQIPGGEGGASGGQPEFILPLAQAALATGAVSALFMEVHPDPPNAFSDAKSQLALDLFPDTIRRLVDLYQFIQAKVIR